MRIGLILVSRDIVEDNEAIPIHGIEIVDPTVYQIFTDESQTIYKSYEKGIDTTTNEAMVMRCMDIADNDVRKYNLTSCYDEWMYDTRNKTLIRNESITPDTNRIISIVAFDIPTVLNRFETLKRTFT